MTQSPLPGRDPNLPSSASGSTSHSAGGQQWSSAGARAPGVVTAAARGAGHVTRDLCCLAGLSLTRYAAKPQTPGGVVSFFRDHRGKPIVPPALFEPIGEKFRRDIKDWAQANGVPVIRFRAGERKADVMAPYLDAAAAAGRSQGVAVHGAHALQRVSRARTTRR